MLNVIHGMENKQAITNAGMINNNGEAGVEKCKCFKQRVGILLAINTPLKIKKQAATTGCLKHSYC